MHFVFGGAFNGKRKWIKKQYDNQITAWYSAYENPIKVPTLVKGDQYIVIEGIERYIKELIDSGKTVDEVCCYFNEQLQAWRAENLLANIIVIGTEIGKGIVPLNQNDRSWRDACGYVYQMLVAEAETVDRIWYGISNRIKEDIKE
ncbi:bifunctional adenosylcobinamide kinase/adenosylcobinamide-phosphate guanylyltransferase [Priestia flexa]|uniref:bifunctional adenosylcobinamide kinase/adenosylcobinamide-phosphate guanylyltransferase n=1 Tax=Priestia flexa TaxID=86664 RepID=UPI0022016092|nr:bifunctional adenosylcobinamide kinase/adenosylcobinamide-phosphate guanylyltransferase [Bacillus sp. 1780r2a1]